MSFELSQTPTLEAVATGDEELLAQDMQTKVAEATKQAEALPDVASAMEDSRKVAALLAKLRGAERALHQVAKDGRERLDRVGQAALDALVESAASGKQAGLDESYRGFRHRGADPLHGARD
jgi:hypothetical protein